MLSETTPSHLSQAILTVNKLEKHFFKTQILSIDRDRNRIRLNSDRHKENFLQIVGKRHEMWYRYDRYFREALKKEKDRHEKRKERTGSTTNLGNKTFSSLVALNSRPAPATKTEQRTYQVLRASQKLLDESAARSQSNLNQSRSSTSLNSYKSFSATTARRSGAYSSASFVVPMTQSIDFEEYTRLMNESLEHETYGNFVDHFIKFRPEFREQFAKFHQANQRRTAVEKLREFNQAYSKQKDQRYYNLIDTLIDFRTEPKRKQYKI